MAPFVTTKPTNDPDYKNESKGYSRVQSFNGAADLVQGFGNIVGQGARAIDAGIKTKIEEDAYNRIDPIRYAHGGGVTPDEAIELAGTGARGARWSQASGDVEAAAGDDVPSGIKQRTAQLEKWKRAYEHGGMSDSHYSASLEQVVQELRSRYPGYREHIDSTVSRITGQTPANALRSSTLRDLNAMASQSAAAAKSNEAWYGKDQEYIHIIKPDATKEWAVANRALLEPEIGRLKAKDQYNDSQMKELALEEKLNTAGQSRMRALAQTGVNDIVNRQISGVLAASKGDMNTFIENAKDPKKLESTMQALEVLEAKTRQAIDVYLDKPIGRNGTSAAGYMTAQQVSDIREQGLERVRTLRKLIGMKDGAGFAAIAGAVLANNRNVMDKNFETRYPDLAVLGGIQRTAGGQFASVAGASRLNSVQKALNDKVLYSTLVTDPTTAPVTSLDQMVLDLKAAQDGHVSGVQQKELVSEIVRHIDNPDKGMAANSVRVLHQNPRFFAVLPEAEKLRFLKTVASPEYTAKVMELTKNDPELKNMYLQNVQRLFQGSFTKAMADAQWVFKSPATDVSFDPVNMTITAKVKGNTLLLGNRDIAQTYVDEMNEGLQIVKPVLEAAYGKQEAPRMLHVLLTQSVFNPGDQEKVPSAMKQVLTAIEKFLTPTSEEPGKPSPTGR
jgi:hypothetical protein